MQIWIAISVYVMVAILRKRLGIDRLEWNSRATSDRLSSTPGADAASIRAACWPKRLPTTASPPKYRRRSQLLARRHHVRDPTIPALKPH